MPDENNRIGIGGSGLIKVRIQPRDEVYYLVTQDMVSNLNFRNIFADLCVLFSSVLWGGYISILLAKSLNGDAGQVLGGMENLFLIMALVFTGLVVLTQIMKWAIIFSVKRSRLNTVDEE